MTERTAMNDIDITYTIAAGNLLADHCATGGAVDRYREMLAAELERQYPHATVTVCVESVSGSIQRALVLANDPQADVEAHERAVEGVSDEVWERWCGSLTDDDVTE